jgi:transposase
MPLVLAAPSYEGVPNAEAEPRVSIKGRHNMDKSEHVAYRAYKILSYTMKLIAYISLAGDMFGAMPVLFGSDSGKVPPAEWARAKLWSVIILVLLFIVSFGMMALDRVMAKRFGKK